MFTILKSAALSALIGIGALAAMPATAQAQNGGFYLGFGNQGPSFGFHFNDRGLHDYRRNDRVRPPVHRYHAGCSPREAARKAARMGLRDVRVVGANHRTVRVEGRSYGHRYYTLTFANAHNCPVLR